MPVIDQWSATTARNVENALSASARELSVFDASTGRYRVSEGGGYSPLTGTIGADVFSLEVRLSPAHRRPGYTAWAIFQVFDPAQPNLALLRMVERRDHDGLPDESRKRPLYNVDIDRIVTTVLMPVLARTLNPLDPTGGGRSQYVTCFHGRLTKIDVFQQLWLAVGLFRRLRANGQAAILITDFHEPLGEPFVRLAAAVTTSHAHLFPRTRTESLIRMPLRGSGGAVLQLGGMSTAVDRGVAIARQYLTTST